MPLAPKKSSAALAGTLVLLVAAAGFVAWEFRHSLFKKTPAPVKVTGLASRDEPARVIRCTLRMTGSKVPHSLVENSFA